LDYTYKHKHYKAFLSITFNSQAALQ